MLHACTLQVSAILRGMHADMHTDAQPPELAHAERLVQLDAALGQFSKWVKGLCFIMV